MSETTEFKDVYEAIASVSPNRQNILYTVLEEDAFGEKAFFSDDKLVWESTKGGFFSQNQEEVGKLHDSGQATAAGKKLFCDCLGGEKRLVICGGGVRYSEAGEVLEAFCEKFGIPFAETQAGKSACHSGDPAWRHDGIYSDCFRGPSSVCQQCQKSRCPPGDLRLL